VYIAVRLVPGARTAGIDAVVPAAGGGLAVKARVAEPAEHGRANAALLSLLAGLWRLRRQDLEIVAGRSARRKTLLVRGEPDRLFAELSARIAALPQPAGGRDG
jgi:uncharacterized protein YggU (UPF0235/DUF167 family)